MKPPPPRFLSVVRILPRSDWFTKSHSHPFHELIVVLDGRLGVEICGQTIEASAGEVLWYPQNVNHREWTDPASPVETLCLSFDDPKLGAPTVLHQTDSLGRIEMLAGWLYSEREAHAFLEQSPVGDAFLHAILAEFLRLSENKVPLLITSIRSYMRQRLARKITLAELARFARVSKSHFIRKYKRMTGLSPMQDLRNLRLQAARDLILASNLPLKEIGPRTGLGDEYHLSHVFRKHFKMAPGTLRRSN